MGMPMGVPMGAPMAAPSMGAPNMDAHNMGALHMDAPDMGAPSMGQPNMGALHMGATNMGAPNMGVPNMGVPNMGPPNMGVGIGGVMEVPAPEAGGGANADGFQGVCSRYKPCRGCKRYTFDASRSFPSSDNPYHPMCLSNKSRQCHQRQARSVAGQRRRGEQANGAGLS